MGTRLPDMQFTRYEIEAFRHWEKLGQPAVHVPDKPIADSSDDDDDDKGLARRRKDHSARDFGDIKTESYVGQVKLGSCYSYSERWQAPDGELLTLFESGTDARGRDTTPKMAQPLFGSPMKRDGPHASLRTLFPPRNADEVEAFKCASHEMSLADDLDRVKQEQAAIEKKARAEKRARAEEN